MRGMSVCISFYTSCYLEVPLGIFIVEELSWPEWPEKKKKQTQDRKRRVADESGFSCSQRAILVSCRRTQTSKWLITLTVRPNNATHKPAGAVGAEGGCIYAFGQQLTLSIYLIKRLHLSTVECQREGDIFGT